MRKLFYILLSFEIIQLVWDSVLLWFKDNSESPLFLEAGYLIFGLLGPVILGFIALIIGITKKRAFLIIFLISLVNLLISFLVWTRIAGDRIIP